LIDFGFIHDELENKYCHTNGRIAESPIRMFKYLLLKTIYTVSDVDVVDRSRFDMSFKYFLDMSPEEEVIKGQGQKLGINLKKDTFDKKKLSKQSTLNY
jgi:hypothetical protein